MELKWAKFIRAFYTPILNIACPCRTTVENCFKVNRQRFRSRAARVLTGAGYDTASADVM